MTKKQLSILIASLFAATPLLAQTTDPFLSTGVVGAGGIITDENSNAAREDFSKFNEYQDLSNGMLSIFGVQGRNKDSWITGYGENFGRDDMYVDLRGGMYDVFKARAYTNWLPHNFLFNGLTPYVGSGGPTLQAVFPNVNPAAWQNVDIGYQRKDTGGYFEWQGTSPWYFRVDGNQIKFSGTKLGSSSNTTSPGGGYVDLAFPVQYETNNVSVEGGYATRTMNISVSYLASNFGNDFETVSWNNPVFGGQVDRSYLPPANDYQRVAANATFRALPWASTLALRYTWDETTSDVNIANSVLSTGGVPQFVLPSSDTFNGKETRQTFTAGWSATPVANLDTRLYYNWQKMNNDSTDVIFCASGASSCGGFFENELFHYEKQNFGVDFWWRFNRSNRLGFGYDWFQQKQDRFDFDKETTNTFWVEWKNTSLETLQARVKYSYLKRDADFLLSDAGTGPNDPVYLERFVRAFDLTNLTQNRVKVRADWTPSDRIAVGFEYLYKDNDYDETVLGRQSDRRNEFFANLTYGTPDTWRLTVFGDYEDIKYDSYHRNVSAGTCPTTSGGVTATNCFDPNTPPNSIAYNWGATVKNNNWMVGVGLDVPYGDRWMFTGSFLYEQADGESDMQAQNNFGNPLPLPNYPNIKITSLNLKANYKVSKNWSVSGGYAYQKYEYNDDAFNGYTNTIPFPLPPGNTGPSYLNGWNAFQSYDANIFWLLLKFTWEPPVLPPPAMKVAEAPPAPPAARPAPPPPPAPAPAPAPAPMVQKITLDSKVLFDFDKAVLKPEGKAAIDSQVIAQLNRIQKLEVVLVTGHTDPIGTDAYNQRLSAKRADAVRDYLVSKGVPKDRIEAIGMGEKQPLPNVVCNQKSLKERIACFAPDRRVEVQAKGEGR
jgi:MtrB/PioB family decaheme-associated outer membrane protein